MLEISLIALKPGKDSVHKVRRPKIVLYDSTLELIKTCTTRAKIMLKTLRALVPKRHVMFHIINILSTKSSVSVLHCLLWESGLL